MHKENSHMKPISAVGSNGTATIVEKYNSRKMLLVVLPYFVGETTALDAKTRSYLAFPYGAISIATYVKKYSKSKSKVIVLDLNIPTIKDPFKEFENTIKQNNFDVIGFSFMFDTSLKWLFDLSKISKEIRPDVPTLVGGASATLSYEELLNEVPDVDYVCYSEGEQGICDLLDSNNFNEKFSGNPWFSRKNNGVKPLARLVGHLDEVIDLDYDVVDISTYSMKESFSPYCSYREKKDVVQFFLVTSRGCPFKCTFCSEPALHGADMRYASVDKIIEHVSLLCEKYNANVLTFYDDQLLLNVPRAKELFRRLIPFNLRLEAPNGVTAVFIDDEMAMLMRQAGFDGISLAIESGSDYVLRNIIDKPLRIPKLKKVVKSLRKADIFIQAFFVIGMPGEEEEHRQETYDLIEELDFDWASFSIASPVRGSQLYEQAKQNGWLQDNFGVGKLLHNSYQMNIPGVDPQVIVDAAYGMNLKRNFVNNRALRMGDYKTARRLFLEVTERTANHAFGYWYLFIANEKLGNIDEADKARIRAEELINNEPKWAYWAKECRIMDKVLV